MPSMQGLKNMEVAFFDFYRSNHELVRFLSALKFEFAF